MEFLLCLSDGVCLCDLWRFVNFVDKLKEEKKKIGSKKVWRSWSGEVERKK